MTNVTKIQVFMDAAQEYRWRGRAANGEIVVTSESYTRREDAVRAARETFPEVEPEHDDQG